MNNCKHKMYIDDVLNYPEDLKKMEEYGCEVIPVDLNGGFVVTNKSAESNLKKSEDSIREKFSL